MGQAPEDAAKLAECFLELKNAYGDDSLTLRVSPPPSTLSTCVVRGYLEMFFSFPCRVAKWLAVLAQMTRLPI